MRPGDVVEVKSEAEILATLDADGSRESMPFMPEMLRHVGRRYTVTRRVEKICDTVGTTGNRRIRGIVYLDDLRCDGSAHGGCQAGCKIYWKEAWLRRVDDAPGPAEASGADPELERVAQAATRTVRDVDGKVTEAWSCQATEAYKASEAMKTSNPTQYWREFKSGNFPRLRFIWLAVRGFFVEAASRVGAVRPLPLRGPGSQPPREPQNIQPGDYVRVKQPAEIAPTLDENGFDRGLSFDREMLPYCGKTLRVKARVDRIIDEKTGRMMKIPKDCLILEGCVCSGERSLGRWFCPREIFAYWREAWVERVDAPELRT